MSNKKGFQNIITIQQGIIDRDEQMNKYFNDLSKCKILTREEEIELFIKYSKTKCPNIKDRIVRANLRFVVSVAKVLDIKNTTISMSDLIQYGSIGLVEAVDLFDHTRGFKFISFAVHHIRKQIYANIRLSRRIHIPENVMRIERQINKEIENQLQLNGWSSVEEDVFDILLNNEELRVSSNYFITNLRQCSGNLSIDSELADYDDLEKSDLIKGDMDINSNLDTNEKILNQLLSKLTDNPRKMVEMFYGIGYNFPVPIEDIGLKFNLSRERIRQIIAKSIEELRLVANIDELELV